MARPTLLLVLVLALAAVATAFVPPTPSMSRAGKTRVESWFGGKKAAAKEAPAAAPAKGKGGAKAQPEKKRATPMKYGGQMRVDKDEEVIVPASEYFLTKRDPIVPILFAGLFVPIFGLLGWWLFSPAPEVEVVDPNAKTSYETYMQSSKAKPRRF